MKLHIKELLPKEKQSPLKFRKPARHGKTRPGQSFSLLTSTFCVQLIFFNQAFKTKPPPAVWNDTVQEQFYPIVSGSAKADLKAAYNKQLKQYVSALSRKKEKKSRSLLFVLWEREI